MKSDRLYFIQYSNQSSITSKLNIETIGVIIHSNIVPKSKRIAAKEKGRPDQSDTREVNSEHPATHRRRGLALESARLRSSFQIENCTLRQKKRVDDEWKKARPAEATKNISLPVDKRRQGSVNLFRIFAENWGTCILNTVA